MLNTLQKQLSLLDHVPVGECVLRKDGTVLFWNACLENWTSISRAQIVGHKIEAFFPHLSESKYVRRLQETFEGGFTVILSSQLHPHLIPCLCADGSFRVQHTIITALPTADETGFDALLSIQDVTDLTQQIQNYKTIQNRAWTEVKHRQVVEEQLRYDRDLLNAILNSSAAAITVADIHGNIIFANRRGEEILGLIQTNTQPRNLGQWSMTDFEGNLLCPDQLPFARVIQLGEPVFDVQCAIEGMDGERRFFTVNGSPLRDETSQITGVVLSMSDITLQKRSVDELKLRYRQERLVDHIVQHIRQSLNLHEILQTATHEIQKLLQADRVLIYRLTSPQGNGRVVAETCQSQFPSFLEWSKQDSALAQLEGDFLTAYNLPQIQQIDDLKHSALEPEYIQFLETFAVKARLAIPILLENKVAYPAYLHQRVSHHTANLWGWLIVHHCSTPRQWQLQEIELLQRLESQLSVAIHQSGLHQQVQHLNINLERQVHARTLELQQALSLEATLKRITDKVRDSLDENQILQTVVEELSAALEVHHCDTTLYCSNSKKVMLRHQFPQHTLCDSNQANCLEIETCFEIYDQLFCGKCFAFCWYQPPLGDIPNRDIANQNSAILACPIVDDQGVLGDLWLFKPVPSSFSHLEIRLVQQVANQCAIAIRQAQLYKAAQQQVEELARLNTLKDDFLSTISHELRTPIASIRMALQTLELLFNRPGKLDENLKQADQYFHLLEDECQREAKLIDDLLDLTRLDAGTEPLVFVPVNLRNWLPHIAEVFEERMREQQQQICFNLPADLPLLSTDLNILERIVVELLNNACKYTPAAETIMLAAQVVTERNEQTMSLDYVAVMQPTPYPTNEFENDDLFRLPSSRLTCDLPQSIQCFEISISNTGVEIPQQELSRIFDKFYRIPNQDPWKYGGTGLGLALAKRMAEYLGGTIQVKSENRITCFTLKIPLSSNYPAMLAK